MNKYTQFIGWLVTSSADPRKVSLTFSAFLAGSVLAFTKILNLACGLQFVCLDVDMTSIQAVIDTLVNISFWLASIISGLAFAYGSIRKVWLTTKK